jgi:hypothetical protein
LREVDLVQMLFSSLLDLDLDFFLGASSGLLQDPPPQSPWTGVARPKEAWVTWRLRFWKALEVDAPASGSSGAGVTSSDGGCIGCIAGGGGGGDGGAIDRARISGGGSGDRGAIDRERTRGED